jgi:hypothetical protein
MNVSKEKSEQIKANETNETNFASSNKSNGIIEPLKKLIFYATNKGLTFGINALGKALGVPTNDTTDPDLLLNRFIEAFNKPETKEKLEKLAMQLAENSKIIMEAVYPPIKEALLDMIEVGKEGIVKIAQSGIRGGLDVIGVVPGIGEVEEGVRTLDDLAKALMQSIHTGLQLYNIPLNKGEEALKNYCRAIISQGINETQYKIQEENKQQQGGARSIKNKIKTRKMIKKRIKKSLKKFHKLPKRSKYSYQFRTYTPLPNKST